MCRAEFEILPHQLFVKNFLSLQTPYNSLLLYHGLGTGKTCSAIGIAEEMRSYMKQMNLGKQRNQRIIVVASPNVQDNFRLQMFDETKLKQINGVWNIQSCIGTTLLNEINPTHLKNMQKERIIISVKHIINTFYEFMGYIEFSNYVAKEISKGDTSETDFMSNKMRIKNIKKVFNNRLIIIDEVHNIPEDSKNKTTAKYLFDIAKYGENVRLLLLSATPMYNSYKEIIWLTNLLNLNDGRSQIKATDVFDIQGNFKIGSKDKEGGRELLHRKLIGYVSYIRGENPYTFPYRVFMPKEPPSSPSSTDVKDDVYKSFSKSSLHISTIGNIQKTGYNMIMNHLLKNVNDKSKNDSQEEIFDILANVTENPDSFESFGFERLRMPIQALNIVYPTFTSDQEDNPPLHVISSLVGKQGLLSVMESIDVEKPQPMRYGFKYRKEILDNHGRIFNRENLPKYSSKISSICENIMNSIGIVLIYSQYIDGGVVPIALALEEMGLTRFCTESYTKSLFETPPTEPIDAITMKPRSQVDINKFRPAKYAMITGNKAFSPNNMEDIKYITTGENRYGENVKVILISKAGAEGLDFKNIRQIHIMEPWYNMNRIEQIIGRGVRNLSHCKLPFEERNVELYLHTTDIGEGKQSADAYVYSLAHKKAIQIGQVTRLLKESAVDCILNIKQTNFTAERLYSLVENQNIELKLSSDGGRKIIYKIGDKPWSDHCDYREVCEFKCNPDAIIDSSEIVKYTYGIQYATDNNIRIIERIRQLFKEQVFYPRKQLIQSINIRKVYPIEQIYNALTDFIENKNEFLIDRFGRLGNLVNREDIYAFQPIEITDENASIYERLVPVEYKRTKISMKLNPDFKEIDDDEIEDEQPQHIFVGETSEELIKQIEKDVETVFRISNSTIHKKDWDFYEHLHFLISHFKSVYKFSQEQIFDFTIYHALDSLLPHQKLLIINGIMSKPEPENNKVLHAVYNYFNERMLLNQKQNSNYKKAILSTDKSNQIILYVFDETKKEWTQSEPELMEYFINDIKKFIIPIKNIFKFIGFFSFVNQNLSVFKVKNMAGKRDKGARVNQGGKTKWIELMNVLQNTYKYTVENTAELSQPSISVLVEFVMRQYSSQLVSDKIMLLTTEQVYLNKILDKV